ncbi:hypothetical protein MOLA814_02081 [Betaproteobacteria bacterium MOLA814]|nr:hypothetical protein MOLA814_02081 [Betaproteobacteria bacterium MOLA814]
MLAVPAAMPPKITMLPSRFSTVRASMTPVLLTTLANNVFFAPAFMMTMPPLAFTKPPFSAKVFNTLSSTCMDTRLWS